jgi:fructose-1,6-bisphosphatase/inositol monophosphatase family enzyme
LDLSADAAAVNVLVNAGVSVLSEESGLTGGNTTGEMGVTVVLDPVDGSTNASLGLPLYATSLCAVDDDGPWVATVADLESGTCYRAVRGNGATRNGEPIGVAATTSLRDAVVGVNGWPERPVGSRQFRAFGCAALELCYVAEGSLDGYISCDEDGHGVWDYLGGTLILREAGGVVVDRHERPLVTREWSDRRTVIAGCNHELLSELAR